MPVRGHDVDDGRALGVADEAGEGVVDEPRADQGGLAQVELVVHRHQGGGDEAVGRDLEHLGGGQRERPVVDRPGTRDEVRVRSGPPRCPGRAGVPTGDRGVQSLGVDAVLDRHDDAVRVALLGGDRGGEHRTVGLVGLDGEVGPADQAVQGVLAGRLGEGELLLRTVERVATVDDAVRPRREDGSAEHRTDLVGVEGHHEVASLVPEGAERCADRGDVGGVPVGGDRQLRSGQRGTLAHVLSTHGASVSGRPDSLVPGAATAKAPRFRRTAGLSMVDLRGLEPLTPCMPCRCATSCATDPLGVASCSRFPGGTIEAYTMRTPGNEIVTATRARRASVRVSPVRRAVRAGSSGSPPRGARGSSTDGLPRGRRARRCPRSR